MVWLSINSAIFVEKYNKPTRAKFSLNVGHCFFLFLFFCAYQQNPKSEGNYCIAYVVINNILSSGMGKNLS